MTEVSQGSTPTQGSLSSQFGYFSKELGWPYPSLPLKPSMALQYPQERTSAS